MHLFQIRPIRLAVLSALASLWVTSSVSVLCAEPAAASTETTSTSKETITKKEKPNKSDEPKRRLITVTNNRTTLDVRQWPLIGNPEAKFLFVEMFDYSCPHCRATHKALLGAMERYGEDLAVIALPTPLDKSCNSAVKESNSFQTDVCAISRMAIAIWRVQPKQFARFHSWVFEQPRTAAEARQFANQLAGEKALEDELALGMAAKYLSKCNELYQRAGAGNVPKLLFPKSTLTGEVSSTDTLCSIIERELGKR